ncbi:MmgE/PrpD family protein [Salinigranum halophilum]|uniref:MmgE/PrpD family protein n=1 Tax=Salinigranum halophilum TaxID=2565931 RepID=UPI0010A7F21B|nr:MmgE/PrpD family protein [Salinigranum halophilum]
MTIARSFAEYAAGLEYEDLDADAVSAAKTRLLDSLACVFAAFGAPPVETAIGYATAAAGDDAPILGGGRGSIENATLANGTLVRYADWNDSYFAKEPAHPSDNFGALLTVAGSERTTGTELLTATVLAYEIQSQLCDAAALRYDGIDHVTYGLVSASLSAGWLQNRSIAQLEQAVNIAVSSGVSLRQIRGGEVSTWKGMAFANAARNAVFALDMAGAGVTGPAPIFEGRFGLSNLLGEAVAVDTDGFGGDGTPFKISESTLKLYPAFQHAQAAIECAIELRETADFDIENIQRIENETYEIGATILDDAKWHPRTRETADHSQPYCVARALLDGAVSLESFRQESLDDPAIQALIDVMEVSEQPAFTDAYGEQFPHRMRIHTNDEVYQATVRHPRGHPEKPLSRADLTEKFALATPALSSSWIDSIADAVDDVEQCPDLMGLFDLVAAAVDSTS